MKHAVPLCGYGVSSIRKQGESMSPRTARLQRSSRRFPGGWALSLGPDYWAPGQDCFRMLPSSSTMAVISLMLKLAFFCTMLYRYSKSS
jgi:hypothetical protein